MEKTFVVYMHTSPSGKSYIGQTCNLAKRNSHHKNGSDCRLFAKAIAKYGWDSFKHDILAEGLTLEQANAIEAEMIAIHCTRSPNGYNLKAGGNSSEHAEETKKKIAAGRTGKKHTPETIAKMRASKQDISDETREKIRQANLGKKASPEARQKMSEAQKKRQPRDEAFRARISHIHKGKTVSEATRKKMSESTKGRTAHNKGVPMSDEQKRKLSKAKTNPSDEVRKRVSDAAKAAWERRRANGTASLSLEHIEAIRASKVRNKKEAA